MSSISVSAENLEAMLQSSHPRPGVESQPQHAASVSTEALEALLPANEREHAGAGTRHAESGYAGAEAPAVNVAVAEIPVAAARVPIAPAPAAHVAPAPVVRDAKIGAQDHPAPSAGSPSAVSTVSVDSKVASEPEPEVEETLPLLAARDRERVERPRLTPPARPTNRPADGARAVTQAARPTSLPSVAKAPVVAAGAQRMATVPTPAADSAPSVDRTKMWVAIGAAVIVLAGASVFFVRGRKTTTPFAAQPPILALQLGAETMGSGLVNVRWNPQSALVERAKSGRLVIKEGDQQPRTVTLAEAELKTGHLLYQSPADRLEFRLETVEASGASTGETIVVEIPKTDAGTPPQGSTGQLAVPPPVRPAGTAPTPAAVPVAVEAPVTVSSPSKPQAKAFTAPVQRTPEPARGVLLDAPGTVPAATAAVSLPNATLPAGTFAAPPPPTPVAPAPPRTGGDLQPATLIRKVAPVYPPLAKAARIQGAVRFSATVGKDGHLQNIQVIGGHSALVQAATDAVKQWVYRPTMLNGEPVEVVTQLEVNFTLNESSH